MKKRILSFMLAVLMLLSLIPATAMTASAATDSIWVGGVEMTNGTYLAVGATQTTTTKPSGGYAYFTGGTLTLNNYSYTGEGSPVTDLSYNAAIVSDGGLAVHLMGSNRIIGISSVEYVCGISVEDELNIHADPGASLTVDGNDTGIYAAQDLVIHGGNINTTGGRTGLFTGKGDVIINGGDITTSGAKGIISNDDLIVNGGRVEARAIDTFYDSAYSALRIFSAITFADGVMVKASTTVEGELVDYVEADNESYKRVSITSKMFITHPEGGTVGYNQRHIASWATAFDPVKLEIATYNSAGDVVQTTELSTSSRQASLPYLLNDSYYRIRAWYDYYDDAYIVSDRIYVVPDPYYTPNPQHGNEEGHIIAGITYVPNDDGTFNANVHVDVRHVDGQMLQHDWGGTGYCWYDHSGKLHYASAGGIEQDEYVFTLNDVGENLEPGKEWRVKVYLAYDYYGDEEWQEVGFAWMTLTVPELKSEDEPEYPLVVLVGGVEMTNGTYLANGAASTTTSKPSGGYAYYKDGTLTLNNYSYTGEGSSIRGWPNFTAAIYNKKALTVHLLGSNRITAVSSTCNTNGIWSEGDLTIHADPGASLSIDSGVFGILAHDGGMVINGGDINAAGAVAGLLSGVSDLIINGGDITASGAYGIAANRNLIVNGGRVEAFAVDTSDGNAQRAIYVIFHIIIDDGLVAKASTTVGGTMVDYVEADNDTYKHVIIESVNPFTDVKKGDFYYDPVMWAVQNGITTGATATTFNPGGTCLRAQVVTFLHRAAGNPEPTSTKNPFTDVKSTDFFYKPVLWAVEKGITNGTSATTFGSYANCNRAAVVTFLWRAKGSPEPKSTRNPFVDVKTTDFFYKAVLWAVENGITNGVDATHFGPTANCNRAQVVTFLYRAYK